MMLRALQRFRFRTGGLVHVVCRSETVASVGLTKCARNCALDRTDLGSHAWHACEAVLTSDSVECFVCLWWEFNHQGVRCA